MPQKEPEIKELTEETKQLVEEFNRDYGITLNPDALKKTLDNVTKTNAVHYLEFIRIQQKSPYRNENESELTLYELSEARKEEIRSQYKASYKEVLKNALQQRMAIEQSPNHKYDANRNMETLVGAFNNLMARALYLQSKTVYEYKYNDKYDVTDIYHIYNFFEPSDMAFGFMDKKEMQELIKEIKLPTKDELIQKEVAQMNQSIKEEMSKTEESIREEVAKTINEDVAQTEESINETEEFINETKESIQEIDVAQIGEFIREIDDICHTNDVLSSISDGNERDVNNSVRESVQTTASQLKVFIEKTSALQSANNELNKILNGKSVKEFLKEAETTAMKKLIKQTESSKNTDTLNSVLENVVPSDKEKDISYRTDQFILINNRINELIKEIAVLQIGNSQTEIENLQSNNDALNRSLKDKSVGDIVSSVREKYINQNAPYESVISAARIIKAKNDSRKGFWARYFHWIDNLRERNLYKSLVAKARQFEGKDVDKDLSAPLPTAENKTGQITALVNTKIEQIQKSANNIKQFNTYDKNKVEKVNILKDKINQIETAQKNKIDQIEISGKNNIKQIMTSAEAKIEQIKTSQNEQIKAIENNIKQIKNSENDLFNQIDAFRENIIKQINVPKEVVTKTVENSKENITKQIKILKETNVEQINTDLDTVYELVQEVKGDDESKRGFDDEIGDFIHEHQTEKELNEDKLAKNRSTKVSILIEAAAPENHIVEDESQPVERDEENLLIH